MSKGVTETSARVFFYGSFMSTAVLQQAGIEPRSVEVTRLSGFDIHIGPLANVVRSERHMVYGIVCDLTHSDLSRLYGQDWVGHYFPEAVLVETGAGALLPALCYVAPVRRTGPAAGDYVDRIVDAAREHGFPEWYVGRLESFR